MYNLGLAVWEITSKCNLNCVHCINESGESREPDAFSTEEGLILIEQLAELGCNDLVLSGGEPFIRKDWAILAQKVRALGMGLHFMTNGLLINDDVINILKNLGISSVSFSLDGASPETHDFMRGKPGAFDKLIATIEKAVRSGITVTVCTTVTRKNFHEIEKIINLLIRLGVSVHQIQLGKLQGRMPADLVLDEREYYSLAEQVVKFRRRYLNKIKIVEADCIGYYSKLSPELEIKTWTGCQCGLGIVCIESGGGVKGCPHRHDTEGNCKETPLKEIWNDNSKFAYNRRFSRDRLKGYCKECSYGNLCRGGCSVNTCSSRGTDKETPYCLYKIEKYGYSD